MILYKKLCVHCGKEIVVTDNIETTDVYRKTVDGNCVCFMCSELPSANKKYEFKPITL